MTPRHTFVRPPKERLPFRIWIVFSFICVNHWSDDAILKKRPQNDASAGRKTSAPAETLPDAISLC
jgi:hypothetical protein